MKKLLVGFATGVGALAVANLAHAQLKPRPVQYEGIVEQVNIADGSFVLRTREGDLVTIPSPVQAGAFLSVRSRLQTDGTVTSTSRIQTKDPNGPDAIPVITEINPGAAAPGDMIKITGTGFLRRKNSINFADFSNALPNVSSWDGKTIYLILPKSPCPPRTTHCPVSEFTVGDYDVSVGNTNGRSNAVKLHVLAPQPLALATTALPEATAGWQYNIPLTATGGVGSYTWSVASGSLPPGVKLVPPVCVAYPCKAPAALAGIPTAPGNYPFTISVKADSETASQRIELNVVPAINLPSYLLNR